MNANLEQAWNDVASALRGYIRTRVSDHFAAEDILQDVYVKAHTRVSQLDHQENLQGWLFRIARNAIIDQQRQTKVSEEIDETVPAEEGEPALERNDAEKLKESFRRMVHNLPEPYREALILADLEGVPQKEVAARLGISFSGAKSRVQRGRQLLKKDLEQCCKFEFDRRGKIIDYTPKGQCCGDAGHSPSAQRKTQPQSTPGL